MSLYEDLEISQNATPEEIKKAHRRGVRKSHPDAGGDGAQFERVQRAYGILSDQRRRSHYDETGSADETTETGEQARAILALASKFSALIGAEDVDPRFVNVPASLKVAFQAEAAQARESRATAQRAIIRLKEYRKRLKVREGTPDALGNVLDAEIQKLGDHVEAIDQGLRICEIACGLADHWDYLIDPQPEQQVYMQMGAATARNRW